MRSPGLTILFSGMIAAVPRQGGATWAILQYLLGLAGLGHDVYFVEPVAEDAVLPVGASLQDSTNAAYFRRVMADFGFARRSALLRSGTRETVGLPYAQLHDVAGRADLLINVAGMLTDSQIVDGIPARLYLDLDPAFTQLWSAAQGIDMRFAGHTHFATVGLAIGNRECPVPTCGLPWFPTLQPVVLDHWPVARAITHNALTTVANWRGYGSIEHAGVFYGQKAHALRPLFDLPTRTDEPFQPALAIHADERQDLAALDAHGWELLDPREVASTPRDYQQFVQGSKAEFGIAKSGYVHSRCGWFSDRSVCYLASGRPVIAQETGFSRFLSTGRGLHRFETEDDVLVAIETLRGDYARQAQAARDIAEAVFDANKVLPRLLSQMELAA